MSDESKARGNILAQAWLVIVLALLYGGALAGVHVWLNPRIQKNKIDKTQRLVPELIAGAVQEQTVELRITGVDGNEVKVLKALGADGTTLGWVIPAVGPGYNETIEILVGLNVDLTRITGIAILAQKETPGLGDRITEKDGFLKNYTDAPGTMPLVVVKGARQAPHEVVAISGATVSSESVTAIVNAAIANCQAPIRGLEGKP